MPCIILDRELSSVVSITRWIWLLKSQFASLTPNCIPTPVEGQQFLIQSRVSRDWIRRKTFLSDLRDSAVNLILKRGGNLFPKQHKQQGEDDADEYGGNNGEVESKILFPNDDIPGKSSDPRNFFSDQQKKSNQDNKNTEQNEHLAQGTKPNH
jgi:hypothetical protein